MGRPIREKIRHSAIARKEIYRFLKICDKFWSYSKFYKRRVRSIASRPSEFPAELSIETTNLCNARCTICAHPDMKRKQGFMELNLVNNLIKQAAEGNVRKLFLSGFGEPLLDKRLPEFISLATKAGIRNILIVTNGYLLAPDIADDLIGRGLNEIIISIDGFTAETYEDVRLGLKFDKLADNIRQLPGLKNRKKARIYLSTVDLLANRGQRKIAFDTFGKYIDDIYFRQAQGWTALYGRQIAAWTPHFAPNNIPCRYLWDSASVYIDGRVPACCLDYEAKGEMGNAAEKPITEIWQGERFAEYRRVHLEGRKSELEPCKNCGYYSVWW